MTRQYFYQFMGEVVGPITDDELRQRAFDGTIDQFSLLRVGDRREWISASDIDGLYDSDGRLIRKNSQRTNAIRNQSRAPARVVAEGNSLRKNRHQIPVRAKLYAILGVLGSVILLLGGTILYEAYESADSGRRVRKSLGDQSTNSCWSNDILVRGSLTYTDNLCNLHRSNGQWVVDAELLTDVPANFFEFEAKKGNVVVAKGNAEHPSGKAGELIQLRLNDFENGIIVDIDKPPNAPFYPESRDEIEAKFKSFVDALKNEISDQDGVLMHQSGRVVTAVRFDLSSIDYEITKADSIAVPYEGTIVYDAIGARFIPPDDEPIVQEAFSGRISLKYQHSTWSNDAHDWSPSDAETAVTADIILRIKMMLITANTPLKP